MSNPLTPDQLQQMEQVMAARLHIRSLGVPRSDNGLYRFEFYAADAPEQKQLRTAEDKTAALANVEAYEAVIANSFGGPELERFDVRQPRPRDAVSALSMTLPQDPPDALRKLMVAVGAEKEYERIVEGRVARREAGTDGVSLTFANPQVAQEALTALEKDGFGKIYPHGRPDIALGTDTLSDHTITLPLLRGMNLAALDSVTRRFLLEGVGEPLPMAELRVALGAQSPEAELPLTRYKEILADLTPVEIKALKAASAESERKGQAELAAIAQGGRGADLQGALKAVRALYGTPALGRDAIDSDGDGRRDTGWQVVQAAEQMRAQQPGLGGPPDLTRAATEAAQSEAVAHVLTGRMEKGAYGAELQSWATGQKGKLTDLDLVTSSSELGVLAQMPAGVSLSGLQDDIRTMIDGLSPPAAGANKNGAAPHAKPKAPHR